MVRCGVVCRKERQQWSGGPNRCDRRLHRARRRGEERIREDRRGEWSECDECHYLIVLCLCLCSTNASYISLPWIASLAVTRTTNSYEVICHECRKHTCTKPLKRSNYEVVPSDALQWLWWLLQSCKGLCGRQPCLMAFKVCWITSYASSILWGQGKTRQGKAREGKGMEGRARKAGIVARINHAPHIWHFLAVNTGTVNISWMSWVCVLAWIYVRYGSCYVNAVGYLDRISQNAC